MFWLRKAIHCIGSTWIAKSDTYKHTDSEIPLCRNLIVSRGY